MAQESERKESVDGRLPWTVVNLVDKEVVAGLVDRAPVHGAIVDEEDVRIVHEDVDDEVMVVVVDIDDCQCRRLFF